MTKLEEVARAMAALYDERLIEIPSPGYWDRHSEDWADLARAAVEALREPNEAQYEALSATDLAWRDLNSTKVWQTYIDAILNEKP